MEHKRNHSIVRLVSVFMAVGLLGWTVWNFQSVVDYIRLHGYQAPQEVVELANDTTMVPSARKIFYVNHPTLADRSSFGRYCSNHGEETIVLGCYHGVDRGIYLFDVTDERLHGVEEVTAAHEMLHAAYDRLGRAEKKRINEQLQQFYETKVQDPRLKDTIAAYRQSEPKDVVNEMHSILATEVTELTPELEAYYRRYFQDRQKIVAFASRYQHEFTARRERVDQYDARLASLRATMDANRAALNQQEAGINAAKNRLDQLRASGTIQEYNAAVPVFNAQVTRYNQLIVTTRNQIDEYNRLVAERNTLALEVKELAESINSQPAPISQ